MNQDGIDLLKTFEGCRLKAYIPVPGDVPTLGYGRTKGVKMGDTCTKKQAEAWLKEDIVAYEDQVQKKCTVHANENQLAAMTCLAYNIGIGAFSKSTVLRAHNKGDEQSACRAFSYFNRSSGVVYAGLTRRRAAESALYLKPEPEKQADHPMPQTVDEETSIATRPQTLLGGATGVSGLWGLVSSASDKASDAMTQVDGVTDTVQSAKEHVNSAVEWFGFSPPVLGFGLLLLIGIAIVVVRYRQRLFGWA